MEKVNKIIDDAIEKLEALRGELKEPEFKQGDIVLVSNDGFNWSVRVYKAFMKGQHFIYESDKIGYPYIRVKHFKP